MTNLEIISKNIKEAIKHSEMSQSEIARQLDIKPQSVQQYLSGKALPALDTFANLCKVLEVDPKDILGLTEQN